jgi:hypothetical protein
MRAPARSPRAFGFSRALFLGAAVLFAACATAHSDFERASRANTPAAFREFLRKHPNSEFKPQAQRAIARLEAKEARSREKRARRRAEDEKRRWQEAESADTLQAYEAFLTHPRLKNSKFRPPAVAAYRKLVRQRALALGRPVERIRTLPSPGFNEQDLRKAFPAGRSSFIEEEGGAASPGPSRDAAAVAGHQFTTLTMASLSASVASSANPRLTAEIYGDPDRGLFVEIDRAVPARSRGAAAKGAAEASAQESIAFSGAGVIVLRSEGPTRVLELGGGSILEGAP